MKKFLNLILGLLIVSSLAACSIDIDWGWGNDDNDDELVTPDPIETDEDTGGIEREEPGDNPPHDTGYEYDDVEILSSGYQTGADTVNLFVAKQELRGIDKFAAFCAPEGVGFNDDTFQIINSPEYRELGSHGDVWALKVELLDNLDEYRCLAGVKTGGTVKHTGSLYTLNMPPQEPVGDEDCSKYDYLTILVDGKCIKPSDHCQNGTVFNYETGGCFVYDGPNHIRLTGPETDGRDHAPSEFATNGLVIWEEPIVFTGAVSPNTEKIVVTSSFMRMHNYGEPTYYEERVKDVYTLNDFQEGDDLFTYRAKKEWGNLQYGSNDFEFVAHYADGSTQSLTETVFFTDGTAEMGKPVIYLYPEETMEVFVNVEPTDGISVSDPELGDGWNVVASPDGKILNYGDYKVYPYLFWEGFAANFVTPEEGFVVAADTVDGFFDEKLEYMGMNATEIADFKEFWVPRLAEDPYYFITFVPQEEFEAYAPLTVEPAPDSVLRVFFDYKGLEEAVEVVEQELETFEREGFTVIEWGGRLY